MDYSLREQTLIITDGTNSISSFKLKDSVLTPQGQLLNLLDDSITAMAFDWNTLNVYWSSIRQPRLQVTSITGAHTAVLIKDGIGKVGCIALHPPSGKVCFTNQDAGTKATVECAHMDGAERTVVWKDAVQPASLVFSSNGDTIYWADMSKILAGNWIVSPLVCSVCITNLWISSEKGTIGSVHMNGTGYREFEAGDGVTAVAFGDNTMLWMTVGGKGSIYKYQCLGICLHCKISSHLKCISLEVTAMKLYLQSYVALVSFFRCNQGLVQRTAAKENMVWGWYTSCHHEVLQQVQSGR